MTESNFDYIIVGAGTAGCLLANRLSADPSKRILLLEAGGKDNYHWIHIPVGYLHCIGNPRTDWLYKTLPDKGLNGRSLRYPRGKVLGGCSSINGMIYMRGQARDFDQWAAKTGDDDWKWNNCLPFFVQHEDYHGGINEFHGVGGEWRIEKQRLRWDILDAFSQACVQAGIPEVEDFNRGNNEGVSYFEVNQKSGWRWNTSKAFLRPAKGRSNLEVWTHAQVAKLQITSDTNGKSQCGGVDVVLPSGRVSVNARQAVVLSAGAVGTPQILQLSGIGPANLLQKYGIKTIANLPGVGQNLQDHLQIRSVYKVEGVKTLNTLSNSLWGKAKIGMEYAFLRTGPMSMAPSQLGAFTRSSADQTYPNIEYHVQPLSLDAFGEPLHDFPAFTASVCNLNPSSRGEINITSPDFLSSPDIVPNYLSTEEDRKVAADSLRVTRQIVSQPALAKYKPIEWKPGEQYQSDEELAHLAGDIATTIFHPVGTASMGSDDDPSAVLDSKLRVRDGRGGVINSLRVVDASAMPSITSGNTNSPTLMMAEKAAQWLVA